MLEAQYSPVKGTSELSKRAAFAVSFVARVRRPRKYTLRACRSG
jgi:hypothetical protein